MVFFVCALLAGCDAAPGAGLEPFPSDGVAGFGKAELVDVCVGGARVTPGEEAAVCVPEGAVFAPCSGAGACEGGERCVCGRCFVQVCGAGAVCPAGEACRAGRCTPVCAADSDCAPGEVCGGGGCTRQCAKDADCRSGEVCDFFGTCGAEPCGPGAACGAGAACEPVTLRAEVREPAVVPSGEDRILFFELRRGAESSVYRGRFEGPLRVAADPPLPVLVPPGDRVAVGAPAALVDGDRVDLFVALDGGESIGLARSGDGGRTFTWVTESLLAPAEPWEDGRVGSPSVVTRGGETYLFHEGGAGAGIGLSRVEGEVAGRLAAGPLLSPADLEDPPDWRSVTQIGSPEALIAGGAVRLYVTGRGVDGGTAETPAGPVPPEPNDSIGMFATLDLATFDRYPSGPVYTGLSGLFGALGEREPAVLVGESGAELYFVAGGADGASVTGLGRASTVK